MSDETPHGGCSQCGRTDIGLKKDGTLRMHVHPERKGSSFTFPDGNRCRGAGKPPKRTQYGVRWAPHLPVITYGRADEDSREAAEAALAARPDHATAVLMAHDYVPDYPGRKGSGSLTDWYEVTE